MKSHSDSLWKIRFWHNCKTKVGVWKRRGLYWGGGDVSFCRFVLRNGNYLVMRCFEKVDYDKCLDSSLSQSVSYRCLQDSISNQNDQIPSYIRFFYLKLNWTYWKQYCDTKYCKRVFARDLPLGWHQAEAKALQGTVHASFQPGCQPWCIVQESLRVELVFLFVISLSLRPYALPATEQFSVRSLAVVTFTTLPLPVLGTSMDSIVGGLLFMMMVCVVTNRRSGTFLNYDSPWCRCAWAVLTLPAVVIWSHLLCYPYCHIHWGLSGRLCLAGYLVSISLETLWGVQFGWSFYNGIVHASWTETIMQLVWHSRAALYVLLLNGCFQFMKFVKGL